MLPREREERRHQRGAPLLHVAPLLDRPDDRGVRGRSANAALLQLPDQARLGVAGGGLRLVAARGRVDGVEDLADAQGRQDALLILELRVGVVGALDVGAEEAGERDHLAGRGEDGGATGAYAMLCAYGWVASGLYDTVMVLGVERATDCFDFESMTDVVSGAAWVILAPAS